MKRLFGILALGLLLLAGCTQKQQAPGSISVAILPGALTLKPGASGLATLQVSRTNYSGNVQVYVAGVPSSVNIGVNASSANSSGLVTLAVSAGNDATPGNYPIQINVTGTGVSASGILNLAVVAPTETTPPPAPANLELNVGTPQVTVGPGGAGSTNIALVRTNLPDNVSLGVTGVPAGVLATINPGITTGSSATLSIAVGNNAQAGTYTLNILAASGSISRTASLQLNISSTPDYNLSVSAASIQVGNTGGASVVVTPTSGFSGNVSLSCSGAPAGVSCAFPTPSVAVSGGPATATMNLTVASTVLPGTYTFTVAGTAGSNVRNATVTLTVTPAGSTLASFELAANSVSMGQGASASSAFTVTPSNGFAGVVNLSCINVPTGFTCAPDPSQVFLGSGMTETGQLRITTATNVTPGVYNLTLKGSSNNVPGGLNRTLNLQVIVAGAGGAFEIEGGNLSVQQGQSGGMGLSVTPTGGFTGTVSFNCSGAVQGVICNVTPNPISFAAGGKSKAAASNATVTVAVASGVPVGNYNLTLTATSGALSRTLTIPLAVTSSETFNLSAYPREQSRLQGQRSGELDGPGSTIPYEGISIGVPIVKVNISRAQGTGQPISFDIASVTDPSGASRPISDLFTLTNFDDDADDLANGGAFTSPVAPFDSITDGRYVRLFANINPEATLGRWQVTIRGTDAVLGLSRTVTFGLRIDAPARLSIYPGTITLRQGQQRGDVGDNSLPLSLVLDPRITRNGVTEYNFPLGIVAVTRNGFDLRNLGPAFGEDTGDFTKPYFFPGNGENGTLLGDGLGDVEYPNTDEWAFDCSFTSPVHTCWSGSDIFDQLTPLVAVTVRDNAVEPAVRNTITSNGFTDNPRYLRLRFSPEAPTGSYLVTVASQLSDEGAWLFVTPCEEELAGNFKTPSQICGGVWPDVDSAGGGYIDYSVSPVVPTATLAVTLTDNYFTLAGTPTSLTMPEYVATDITRTVTLTPSLTGDSAGGGSIDNPGRLGAVCPALPDEYPADPWSFNMNPELAVFLAPLSPFVATLTKDAATDLVETSVSACYLEARVGVMPGFAWWARLWPQIVESNLEFTEIPYYGRVVKVIINDQ